MDGDILTDPSFVAALGHCDESGAECESRGISEFASLVKKLKRNHFSILSQNVRSLDANFEKLENFLQQVNESDKKILFSVIAMQETWQFKTQHQIPHYQKLIAKTRTRNQGGGVGFFIKEGIEFEEIEDASNFEERIHESLFIRLKGDGGRGIIIGNIYRPNTYPYEDTARSLKLLLDSIELVRNKFRRDSIILVGDFNVDLSNILENDTTIHFASELVSRGFKEHITRSTRIANSSETIIDHVWTYNISSSAVSGVIQTEVSDHFSVFLTLQHSHNIKSTDSKSQSNKKRKITDDSLNSLGQALAKTNWSKVVEQSDPKVAYDTFFQIFNNEYDRHCPLTTIKQKNRRILPRNPWLTPGLMISRQTKEKLLKDKINLKTCESKEKFYEYNRIYTKLIKLSKRVHYSREFAGAKGNSKKTWDLLRGALKIGNKKSKSDIPTSMKSGEEVLVGDKIASGFNNYFSSIGQDLAKSIPQSKSGAGAYLKGKFNKKFQFQELCQESIEWYSLKLKDKTSVGFDGVSSRVIKRVTPAMIGPLCHLFNLSLKTGYIPPEFKISRVIPLFKGGKKDEFGNYRPISIIPALSKLFEIIVNDQIRSYFNCYNLFTVSQFGFRKGSNPTLAVAKFIDQILKNEQDISIGVFIDVKKAFDTVNHNVLLSKLKFYGFDGVELKLMENYLTGRFQYTDVDGVLSDLAEILAGVPQGSILGPLLFLIYVNDFPCSTKFKSFLFADDTSLFMSGKSLADLQIKVQTELNKVKNWFEANRMQLNGKKTRYIIFNQPKTKRSDPFKIELGGVKLYRVSEESDEKYVRLVWVLLDEDLSFKHHVAEVKAKVNRVNFVLARSKNVLPPDTRLLIYNTLVRSVLEFACVLYGAARKGTVNVLEKIQKKIVRNVKGAKSRAHTNNLFHEFKILKLRDLVEYNQRIFGHGIWYKKLPENIQTDFERVTLAGREMRSKTNLNLKIPLCKKRYLEVAPCFSVSTAWNSLDKSLKSELKLNTFKKSLRENYLEKYRSMPKCSHDKCYSCAGSSMGS